MALFNALLISRNSCAKQRFSVAVRYAEIVASLKTQVGKRRNRALCLCNATKLKADPVTVAVRYAEIVASLKTQVGKRRNRALCLCNATKLKADPERNSTHLCYETLHILLLHSTSQRSPYAAPASFIQPLTPFCNT